MARLFVVLVLGIAFLQGCATTSSPSSAMALENRVQALENRLAVVEADVNVEATPSSAPSFDAILSEDRPATVGSASQMTPKDIQRALKNAGYYDGVIDGKIGPKTRTALRKFQDDMSLKVDGIAGRNTKEKLFKYL